MDNQVQYSEDHYVLPELTFKDKMPQGMEYICLQYYFSIPN